MGGRFVFSILIVSSLLIVTGSKNVDPYKILGVEKNASQREIQKAFHKLSLQYHPDKNKHKSAQQKFSEINNAYEILSDEEKRKNYDLYGDEKGNPGINYGTRDQREYYTSGGQGNSRFNFRPDEWQHMGAQNSKSFSFSFGGPTRQNRFGFGLNDIFSNFFGGAQDDTDYFGGFGSSTKPKSETKNFHKTVKAVNSNVFEKEITDQGVTWLLLAYTSSLKEYEHYESIMEDVSRPLQGALKVGSINCEREQTLCIDIGIYPRKSPKLFIFSYRVSESGSLVEYNSDLNVKSLKIFCQDHLPKFSTRVDLELFKVSSNYIDERPIVMLISTKKVTPVIWRAISGLYRKSFTFHDVWVHDVNNLTLKRLGTVSVPAIIGWLPNGEKHVLKTGISIKDLKSGIRDLSAVLDGFERTSKKATSSRDKKTDESKKIPLITKSSFEALCGDTNPVCFIGAFRSPRAMETLESILLMVSQKSLSRRPNRALSSKDPISYVLLDAGEQIEFLNAFEKSGFKSSDGLFLAYKPRKDRFAEFYGEMRVEEVEKFIGSVLNGDVQFNKTRHKPRLN